jgi:hypothetical protein
VCKCALAAGLNCWYRIIESKLDDPLETQEDNMKSFAISAALLAGFGALVFMGTAGSTVPASAKCMFDEGYGRYTPCSAMWKSKKCFLDEGNGRYTPCSALVKSKGKKKG